MVRLLGTISIYQAVVSFLVFLSLLGSFFFGFEEILWQVLPPVIATVVSGVIFDYLETKSFQFPTTPLISGLIIGLVAQFREDPLTLALIGIVAMGIKFVVRVKGRRVFNPAASGLFLGMIILGSYPSWWGGERIPLVFLIWIPILLYKLGRWAPIVGFLLPVALVDGLGSLTSGSLLFFTSVMLIEPITSPFKTKPGLLYGLIVAMGFIIFGRFTTWDALIPALLIGNLFHVLSSRLNFLKLTY